MSLQTGARWARRTARRGRTSCDGLDLDAYCIGPLVGRGGMGEVYQATHRLLQRPVAIKVVRPEALIGTEDDEILLTLRRFQREARATASLHSPHTVELYDFGMTVSGALYIVMELLVGMDLEQLVDRFGPVPAERAVHFLQQTLSALGEMHGLGLVHRDIKPANLHISQSAPCPDFLKITDLGLVKPPRGATLEHVAMHASGRIVGTPAYIAPEVIMGAPGDERTDIYSLGCVAYWLLTGRTVFDAKTAPLMLHSHVDEAPVPPSQRTETPVPPALERVMLACLEKDPRRRPQSVQELSHQLELCDLGQPWTPERAMQWWGVHVPARRTAFAV